MDFRVYIPTSTWIDKSAPDGQQRKIGGIVSTENRDQEDEVILQRGLDFSKFLRRGWFNDNHSKRTADVVGFPVAVKMVEPGERLPNGDVAKARGHWAEGYLLDGHKPADDIWSMAQALHKTSNQRRLGFSIEGRVLRRDGPDGKVIAKAEVENVAVTNCPVNAETGLSVLTKSLKTKEAENGPPDPEEKDLGSDDDLTRAARQLVRALMIGVAGGKPGGGKPLAPQSLEHKPYKETWKSLSRAEAFVIAQKHLPQASAETLRRIVLLAEKMR